MPFLFSPFLRRFSLYMARGRLSKVQSSTRGNDKPRAPILANAQGLLETLGGNVIQCGQEVGNVRYTRYMRFTHDFVQIPRIIRYLLYAGGLLALLAPYLVARILPPPNLTLTPTPSNLILDRRGNLLYEWVNPNGAQHRPVSLDQIAPECVQATIATEDARFFHHLGVDPVAIARSVYYHLRYGTPLTGASTLTQQLVRISLLAPGERYRRTITRKLKEAWLAWRLERHLSKEEILTLYLNRAYYGNFATGIEAAAHAYFGQSARTLNLAQCALLAGLPQAPAAWNPISNPRAAKIRQRVVLDRMLAEGMITPDEHRRALAEPLPLAASPFPIEAPHFVSMVQTEVEKTLGVEIVRAGGLIITTTLDLHIQKEAEAVVRDHLYRLNHTPDAPPDRRVTSAAVVVMNPHTGEILALVGSPNYFDRSNAGAVNGALALRQPGSAIKPMVYAAAFDPAHPRPWGPSTLVLDARTRFPSPDGSLYIPQNYDLKWHGIVPVRVALGASFNVPAVKALQHAGLERFLALADRMGLDSLARVPRPGLALALGAGEVSLLELTRAYAILANGGTRVPSRLIREVHFSDGHVLHWPETEPPVRALDPRVAYLVTDILTDRHARVPTFGLNSPLELDRPAAAKTGTTTDWRDAWTVGYTPDLVTGVWVGNWDNTPMEHLTGGEAAAPLWHVIMTFAHRGRPRRPFPRPKGIVDVSVCLCHDNPCPDTVEPCPRLHQDIAIAGVPIARAEAAVQFAQSSSPIPSSSTPTPQIQEPPQFPVPASRTLIVSPDPQAEYRILPTLPPQEQSIPLVVSPPPGSKVTFLVDGGVVGTRLSPPYRVWWPLQPGRHRIEVRVESPEGGIQEETVEITVIGGEHGGQDQRGNATEGN